MHWAARVIGGIHQQHLPIQPELHFPNGEKWRLAGK
jgi:hypothetical protein